MNEIELCKLYITADQESKNMVLYILKNPDKVAPIIENCENSVDELRKKLREIME